MARVYDSEYHEVLLAKFTDSQMMADNVGKATSHMEDYWRAKTYVKPIDMLGGAEYPVFPQPYSWAAANFGGSWNDYNQPMLVQVAMCNLNCWYCFVDKDLRSGKAVTVDGTQVGAWFTAKEVLEMFKSSEKETTADIRRRTHACAGVHTGRVRPDGRDRSSTVGRHQYEHR